MITTNFVTKATIFSVAIVGVLAAAPRQALVTPMIMGGDGRAGLGAIVTASF